MDSSVGEIMYHAFIMSMTVYTQAVSLGKAQTKISHVLVWLSPGSYMHFSLIQPEW